MTWDEIMQIFRETTTDHWHKVGEIDRGEERHYSRAVFKPDPTVSLEWGEVITPYREFHEDWTNKFPDSSAGSYYCDILLNGDAVRKVAYVAVDGHRCDLPLGRIETQDGENVRICTRWEYDFFNLFNELQGVHDYQRYFETSEMKLEG